jgi:hypothetical protein
MSLSALSPQNLRFLVGLSVFALVAYFIFDVGRSSEDLHQLVSVHSSVDDADHFVLDTPYKQQAADLLARVEDKASQIVEKFRANPSTIPPQMFEGVQRLLEKPIRLRELDSSKENTVAYNVNKGESIYLCLRGGGANGAALADEDVLLSVLIHELAHAAQTKYSGTLESGHSVHDAEFKKIERFLMNTAASLSLLSPSKVIGRNYCSIAIPNPDTAT